MSDIKDNDFLYEFHRNLSKPQGPTSNFSTWICNPDQKIRE